MTIDALPAALVAAIAAVAAPGGPASQAAPVRLVAHAVEGGVRITVEGLSAAAFAGSYRLQVSGGSCNRSTQSGTVRLRPGVPATMVTTRISANGGWTARLLVEPANAAAYEEVRSSADAS